MYVRPLEGSSTGALGNWMACTTVSAPVKALPSETASPAKACTLRTRPSHGSGRSGWRVVTTTSRPPSSSRRATTCRPMNPVPPATTTRIRPPVPAPEEARDILPYPWGVRRALVVEDDADIVELVSLYLAKDGWDVEAVADGKRAIERARRGGFQLVILDIQLPGLDGLSVCRELRRDRASASVPVVMLTARGDEADRVVGLEMGADDY